LIHIDQNGKKPGCKYVSYEHMDDFGLNAFDNQDRQALMDIVESKHDRSSIIISTQIPVTGWHELIGEPTIADAILDRIIHSSHRIQLKGESMRKNRLK